MRQSAGLGVEVSMIKRLPRMQGARVSAETVIDDAQHDQPAAPAPELPGQLAANGNYGMLQLPVPVADCSAIALKPRLRAMGDGLNRPSLDVTPQPRVKLPPVLGANEAGTVAVAKYKLTASIQMSAHLASVRALKNMRRAGRNSKKRARRNSTLATNVVQLGEGRMRTNPAVQVEHFEFSATGMSTFVVHPDSLRRVLGRIRDQHDDPSSTPPASTHWFNMAGFNADTLNVFRDVFRMRPEAIDQVCEKIDIPMCTYFQDDLDSLASTRFKTDDGSVASPPRNPLPDAKATGPSTANMSRLPHTQFASAHEHVLRHCAIATGRSRSASDIQTQCLSWPMNCKRRLPRAPGTVTRM